MVASRSADTSTRDSAESDRALRVMVVDDEADTVVTLLELLREEGYHADGFGGGRVALDNFQRIDPDVIISDIAMPAPNGWDLAKEVRRRKDHGPRPFMIAISGKYMKGADRVLAQISGFDYFLTKPYDPQVLLALIRGNARRT
jgi:DNA-binding response OmpR family regulator